MARPTKRRRICGMPEYCEFAPSGGGRTDAVDMTVDEYEAVRLADYLHFSQEECAKQMNVARTTVQFIYESARGKMAQALVEGKRLCIAGGSVEVCPRSQSCCGRSCPRRGGVEPCPEDRGDCPSCLRNGDEKNN